MKLGQDQFHASTRDSWNQSDLDEPFHHHTSDGQDRRTAEIGIFILKTPVRTVWTHTGNTGCLDLDGWDCAGRHVLHDEGENLFGSSGVGSGVVLTVRTSCQQ